MQGGFGKLVLVVKTDGNLEMTGERNKGESALQADLLRVEVRNSYAAVAQADNAGSCCGVEASCCGVSDDSAINQLISTRLGYSQADIEQVPAGADMGLGCGNP